MRKILSAVLLLLAFAHPAATQENRLSSGNVRMVMQRLVEDEIIPAYRDFEAAAGTLETRVKGLCAAHRPEALQAARQAFSGAATAWARIEFVRFGPVMSQNRLERVLFWPDRKGTGLKQVQAALANEDPAAADAAALPAKSVAMQGLGAIEFLLFGTGAEELTTGAAYRCGFAAAASANIRTVAAEIVAGWTTGGAAEEWIGQTDPEDVAASLNELVATLVHGLEAIRDVRLRGFLDTAGEDDRPKGALFWRSGQTLPALAANVDGLLDVFVESGMEVLLPQDQASIADSMAFEFREARDMLSSGLPVGEALTDADIRGRLIVADLVLDSLIERIDTQFAPATGLAAGFSFADGD